MDPLENCAKTKARRELALGMQALKRIGSTWVTKR
jgi:hypothetical protein